MDTDDIKQVTLSELAKIVGGQLSESDSVPSITGVAAVHNARSSELTFLSTNKPDSLKKLQNSKAAAAIVPEGTKNVAIPCIYVKNPYLALREALNYFHPYRKPNYEVHPTAFVSENAVINEGCIVGPKSVIEDGVQIGENCHIGSLVSIGRGCTIGKNTRIASGAAILEDSVIGDYCVIQSNAVIGSDGFGFTQDGNAQVKIPQVGNVVIEDNVELGACVTVDRATMGSTIIGQGTKIDNLVHIAHNVVVGKNCVIVAQVGISGSTVLEDSVTMAGQTGTVGHVRIGQKSTVAARGVVTNDVEPGKVVSGFPIKPHSEERKILASLRKLPDLIKRMRHLEKNYSKGVSNDI